MLQCSRQGKHNELSDTNGTRIHSLKSLSNKGKFQEDCSRRDSSELEAANKRIIPAAAGNRCGDSPPPLE